MEKMKLEIFILASLKSKYSLFIINMTVKPPFFQSFSAESCPIFIELDMFAVLPHLIPNNRSHYWFPSWKGVAYWVSEPLSEKNQLSDPLVYLWQSICVCHLLLLDEVHSSTLCCVMLWHREQYLLMLYCACAARVSFCLPEFAHSNHLTMMSHVSSYITRPLH